LPTYGIHDDLEDVRQHVLLRIGLRVEFLALGGLGPEERRGFPSVAFGASFERMSRNSMTPAPDFAEAKQTG
jgi:hypothetical protein